MIGIAVVKQSSAGVSEVNSDVDIMDVFQKQILPELQDLNHSSRPVVKATSIKFVSIFRNQFSKENMLNIWQAGVRSPAPPLDALMLAKAGYSVCLSALSVA